LFDTVGIDNVNSWISGGGFLGVLSQSIWCRIKIKSQCATIADLKKEIKDKADKEVFDKMDFKNDAAHNMLFEKIDKLPEKIMALMKQ
jgi:hypothetical protein